MKLRTLPTPWGITVVRVMAGLILVVAAYEKYSAGGFDGFTRTTTSLGVPLPQLFGIFIPLLEGIGGALLLVGLGARWVAVLFVIVRIAYVLTYVGNRPRLRSILWNLGFAINIAIFFLPALRGYLPG